MNIRTPSLPSTRFLLLLGLGLRVVKNSQNLEGFLTRSMKRKILEITQSNRKSKKNKVFFGRRKIDSWSVARSPTNMVKSFNVITTVTTTTINSVDVLYVHS